MTRKQRRKPRPARLTYTLDGQPYTLTAPVKVIATLRRALKRAGVER